MKISHMLITVIMFILAIWLGLTVGDRSYPTTIESAKLLTPIVEQGGELLTERTVYRSRLCHTTIERMMFDSRDIRFDGTENNLGSVTYPNGSGPIGRDTFIGRQEVPYEMALGKAKYVALVCYRCNWAQIIWPLCEPPREQRFTVVERGTAKTP